MLENTINEQLNYQKLSQEEMDARGILGRLHGPCADIINATRNGRKYSEQLWETVFDSPLMKEKFERGGVFGECGHPIDREEVDIEKIAICMPEPPKKDNEGKLVAVFDILNTPCGKILKTLCDYGYKIGISSRGTGDTFIDNDGNESVDPDTYDCECFDAVLIPAVKAATLELTESLSKKSFKRAICEALETSSEIDRKKMEDTLNDLNIDYKPEKVDNSNDSDDDTANNDGVKVVEELQEALKNNQVLEKQITELQEKLSVCYAEDTKLKESIERYKNSIENLSKSNQKIGPMRVKLNTFKRELIESKKVIVSKDETIKSLQEKLNSNDSHKNSLNESIKAKNSKIHTLENQINELNESLDGSKKEFKMLQNKMKSVTTTLEEKLQENEKQYTSKLSKSNKLIEKYRNVASSSLNRYIDLQALRIGATSNEIKNRLNENFSFDDIDKVCEELQRYKLNISKLPFDVRKESSVKMKVKESIEPIKPANRFDDDDIDEQLKSLAGLI